MTRARSSATRTGASTGRDCLKSSVSFKPATLILSSAPSRSEVSPAVSVRPSRSTTTLAASIPPRASRNPTFGTKTRSSAERVITWLLVRALQDRRDPLAPTDAERREPVALLSLAQLVGERQGESRTRRAERMAERDRTAVHVRLLAVEAEVLLHREVLRREGLVDLDEIHVLDFEARALERLT